MSQVLHHFDIADRVTQVMLATRQIPDALLDDLIHVLAAEQESRNQQRQRKQNARDKILARFSGRAATY